MNYEYGLTSQSRLITCDQRLQKVFLEAIKVMDISIICGYRGEAAQNKAFNSKNSKVEWPDSKHNTKPSKGIDAVPYPSMWDNEEELYYMAGIIKAISVNIGIEIRWGGDWDSDNDFTDNEFNDLGHWELVE